MNSPQPIISLQIQSFTLQSPIHCTFCQRHSNSIKFQKQNQNEDLINICKKQKHDKEDMFSLTIWDMKNKIQTFSIGQKVKKQTQQARQYEISKINDIRINKCAIKKAFITGIYFIIHDQDNIVTIRRQWEIVQCFSDIIQITLYDPPGKQSYNNDKTILVMNQVKIHSVIDFESQGCNTMQSQLIFLEISHNQNKEDQQQIEEIIFQTIKLPKEMTKNRQSQNIILQLSKYGNWASYKNQIILINVFQQKAGQQLNELQVQYIDIRLKYVLLKYQSHQIPVNNIISIFMMKSATFNIMKSSGFNILYLNDQNKLCSLQIQLCKQITNIKKLTQGDKIQFSNEFQKKNSLSSMKQIKSISFEFVNSQNGKDSLSQWKNLIFFLEKNYFWIYQTNTCRYIGKIILLGLSQYSISQNCMIIYSTNYQTWILDKNNMCIHCLDLKNLLKQQLLRPIIQNISKENDNCSKKHSNTLKILSLRLKILKTLQSYLTKLKGHPDYPSCLRLLNNEQNISIINDGLIFLVNQVTKSNNSVIHLQNYINDVTKFEDNLITLLNKLILSKYQSHIEKGLQICIQIYDFFRQLSKCQQTYKQICSSKRVQRLLNQQKNKLLFELAYTLNAKVNSNGKLN